VMVGMFHVAVHRRVAVSRKMFHGGQRVVLLVAVRSFDEGLHLRRTASGFSPNERILMIGLYRIIVNVGHRIEDPMNSQRPRLARRHLAPRTASTPGCRGAETPMACGNTVGALHPHRNAALENRRSPSAAFSPGAACGSETRPPRRAPPSAWTRPLAQFTRINPPTFVSRICAMNLRYSPGNASGAPCREKQ